jgi:hypothetical protein
MRKLIFQEIQLTGEWWEAFGESGARIALLIGDLSVADHASLLENMRDGRVAGVALNGILV